MCFISSSTIWIAEWFLKNYPLSSSSDLVSLCPSNLAWIKCSSFSTKRIPFNIFIKKINFNFILFLWLKANHINFYFQLSYVWLFIPLLCLRVALSWALPFVFSSIFLTVDVTDFSPNFFWKILSDSIIIFHFNV